jgi:hypothetical protein
MHPVNEIELACERDHDDGDEHSATLRDYAYPGSATTVTWMDDDRRNFRLAWPGNCSLTDGCILPDTHRGRCST